MHTFVIFSLYNTDILIERVSYQDFLREAKCKTKFTRAFGDPGSLYRFFDVSAH